MYVVFHVLCYCLCGCVVVFFFFVYLSLVFSIDIFLFEGGVMSGVVSVKNVVRFGSGVA